MTVDTATRLQYLNAMGIDVWVPKASACAESPIQPDHWPIVDELRTHVLPPPLMTMKEDDDVSSSGQAITGVWETLEAEVSACSKCDLCQTRTQTVFGTGNMTTEWLLIGEGPGQHEDEQGKPFVGMAGLLLTEMLRAIGLEREEVFITNIVKCRPPNNRDPKPEEVQSCHDYLERQIALIQPKIILALGRIASQTLLDTDAPMARLRGKVHYLGDIPLVVVYHPAYLLRSLLEKRKAWQDLKFARQTLKERQG